MSSLGPSDSAQRQRMQELSSDEMRALIRGLAPAREMHAGVRFLTLMLEEKGVRGVVEFVEKGHKILDEEGKLLDYDFDDGVEQRLLKRARPNVLDRRTFLHTVGWGVAGGVGVPYYSAEIADKLSAQGTGERGPSVFRRVHDWIGSFLVPPAELLISASLVNEMIVNWRETKLDEVSNAVAEAIEALRYVTSNEAASAKRPRT